jgi:hypothetical protein
MRAPVKGRGACFHRNFSADALIEDPHLFRKAWSVRIARRSRALWK